MEHKDYIKWLVESKHYPTKFSFGITMSIENPDIMEIVRYEIGLNAKVDNNIKIIDILSRSLLIEVNICGISHEFRVYSSTSISPDEFYDKISYAIDSRFYGLTDNDEGFDNFKTEYANYQSEFYKSIKKINSNE